jgi:hypothetical protein
MCLFLINAGKPPQWRVIQKKRKGWPIRVAISVKEMVDAAVGVDISLHSSWVS